MQKRGRQIRLFYVDGQHNGIVRAELMNWTGYVYAAPRASLKQLIEKDDAHGSGIYFLISKAQELEGKYSVYVGETVNGIQRMQHHEYNKDFWDTVILVQCKDTTLTKTHCAYLEYQVYQFIKDKTLYQIENKQVLKSYAGRLSDADISDMDTFLDNLSFVLPALGVNILTPVVKIPSQSNTQFASTIDEAIEAEFSILSRDKKVDGKAYIKEGVFYVRQGSIGKEQQTSSQHNFIINQRQSLIDKGMIRVIDEKIEFTHDVAFTSTSTPAAMLFGRPTSGPSTWKLLGESQISYKDWEEMQVKL
ncbi:GIY-YIG nuclease family protein [uncultured Acinetobacter sp.]|uniref:GIY-YIG nuclease family protein n=1 Tax=uncultured Acinetobacter sp. TaxID=165433 RepID=UPI0025830538|nr:GIY-YIG nuclease family protein [uncultured Acinetobacter sp.]